MRERLPYLGQKPLDLSGIGKARAEVEAARVAEAVQLARDNLVANKPIDVTAMSISPPDQVQLAQDLAQ